MTFKHFLLASWALVISATAATAQVPSYVPTNGLVGWWPFNGNANDESGNGNDGIVNGATLTADRFGNESKAYFFSGNTIDVGNAPELSLTTSGFTVSVWANKTGGNSWHILGKRDLCGGFQYQISSNDLPYGLAWGGSGQNNFIETGLILNNNQWDHFVGSFDGTTWRLYLNSTLIDSSVGSAASSVNSNLLIGNSGTCEPYFGVIDDIAIYNRALTPQEIQNLYNGTTETVDTGNGAAPLPQGIPYQAAARDAQGQSLVNAAVNVRFTLHEGAADGAASYAETHALTTNSVGLFNTVFGSGTPEQSAFDSINWAATTKFLQVEIDLGEGYVDMGTTQLLSVPYALRSDEAARVKNAGLPIFNDNAAALAGGLVAGEMYRTAAGVLMIVY